MSGAMGIRAVADQRHCAACGRPVRDAEASTLWIGRHHHPVPAQRHFRADREERVVTLCEAHDAGAWEHLLAAFPGATTSKDEAEETR
jgi:hypothetical protein